jgi:gamma-glutamylputrescine oxidase
MGRLGYVASYYAASARAVPERAALAGWVAADVCVVGGGIAGCSAALHLAERGFQVVLLEEHRIGWGASGRSGAQAIYGVAAAQGKLERLLGPAGARTVWEVSVEALALMRELIRRYSIDCDWVDGYMLTAVKERHVRELRADLAELRDAYGYPSVRYLEREEVRTVLDTDRYLGALYDSNSGHLHPLNYTL